MPDNVGHACNRWRYPQCNNDGDVRRDSVNVPRSMTTGRSNGARWRYPVAFYPAELTGRSIRECLQPSVARGVLPGASEGVPPEGGSQRGVPGGVPGGALRGTCHREATRGGGLGAGQAPPPTRGRKKCTFFLVFNNSPSRDRCLVRMFSGVPGAPGGFPGGYGGTPPGGAQKSIKREGTDPQTVQSRVPSQAVPGGPRGGPKSGSRPGPARAPRGGPPPGGALPGGARRGAPRGVS